MGISRNYIEPVAKLREFIRDFKEENELLDLEENTDYQLQLSLEDALDYINTGYQPITEYTLDSWPSWTALRDRAALMVLTSNMIKSARNMLQYSDPGGVNIRENDVYGRYVNLFNVLLAKNELHIMRIKQASNFDAGFGGVDSEYITTYNNDWY